MDAQERRVEELGPAERIINSLTQHVDHMVHNRPGFVTQAAAGVQWQQATWVQEKDDRVVYTVRKVGKKQHKTKVGVVVPGTTDVRDGNRVVGRFQPPGLFQEVVGHLYKQIAEVWKMDNEFAAKWASWAFENEDKRDLKVLLAAFMLVQGRFGEPVREDGETFLDDDYRAVGEAMCLLRGKKKGSSFNPKLLLRIGEVLECPQVVAVNRELQFGQSMRRPVLGRYYKVVEKYLHRLDLNPKVLENLVKGGFRKSVMALARKVGYKPETEKFFEILRWKQVQSKDGHRTVAVGKEVKKADSWEGLSEEQVCEKIEADRPSWKVIVGKLPMGITPAIMYAAIGAGSLSDQDLIILTPTLEELGLLENEDVHAVWKRATERAENQRAENIAKNVRSKKAKEGLEKAVDAAAAKAVEEVARDMRIYVVVDKSGSMQGALEKAKEYLSKFVGAFPLNTLHVSVFNTVGREVEIKAATRAAVVQAFRGHTAGGGTSYANGLGCLINKYQPGPNEDAIVFFVGDQQDGGVAQLVQVAQLINPVAFGLLHVDSNWGGFYQGKIVEQAAVQLGIPCFRLEESIFEDAYAVPRTIRNIIAATPVKKGAAAPRPRHSIIETILKTPLLQKPAWA